MREILQGVVDLHIHAGPSVAEREVDAAEMLKEAIAAGYKAFVIKDHYFPTMMSASLVQKHIGNGTTLAFGGIAMNNSVGLFNIKAVDAAYNMGAKFVNMPTVSAKRHIDSHKGRHFAGAGSSGVEEEPVYYLDEKGNLKAEVVKFLNYMATKPDLILSTGHGSPEEIDALINEGVRVGVKKILVNHPFLTVNASIEQITSWSKLGAYIELNSSAFPKFVPLDVAAEILENVAIEQLVVDTDSGQKGGGSPVDSLYRFIRLLMNDLKVPEQQINMMTKETPSKLLGI